ncbi:hypothetical protein [Thiohalophilus thiocyanatoxydans]|uniref:Uncharacterized protein n=1 Tax=Thiohalophilus thiocyanatoxydans TaxID=381308 RepID=A0A4V3H3K5_9GAMM|nr:hypothetical protein [Thiohalophilus thiocyanatoxydans]TDX99654.1 hypothetical protein EDC23_2440 [Thiohalophilus thiocyanatoxydans]
MRILVTLLALVISGVCTASQGYIEKAGTRLEIKDSVAVLDEQVGKLTIYLLPSRLSAREKKRMKAGNAMMVLLTKSSPDNSKWGWYPYATLEMRNTPADFSSAEVLRSYYLMVYGINKKNATDNLNGRFSGNEVLRNYRFDEERVQFRFSGRQDYFDIRWQLEVNAPLL